MIISDNHRFAFVHIPKCAGVSVKRPLRAIDTTQGYFSRIGEHAEMGRIHLAHITLRDLAQHFPDETAKLHDYRAFAVVRDPSERFLSALFQRLREFRHFNQSEITRGRIEQEAAEVIRYLESAPERLDLEHVHFNRQSDYVFHGGKRVVDDIFPIERMADIIAYVADRTGIAVEEERRNRSTEVRFAAVRPLVRLLRRPYAALVPYALRNRVRTRLVGAGIYGDVDTRKMIRAGGYIDGFVRSYYAEDFELHAASL